MVLTKAKDINQLCTTRTLGTLFADVRVRIDDVLRPRSARFALLQIGSAHLLLCLQLRPRRTPRELEVIVPERPS
jgi:hypothetical protein